MSDNPDTLYVLTGHELEAERLEAAHRVTQDALGSLTATPIDLSSGNGLRILDIATCDGRWLRDLHAQYGSKHTYIGTDIVDTFFPPTLPDSVSLMKHNFNSAWPEGFPSSFDLVHVRNVILIALDPTRRSAWLELIHDLIRREAELVKPGGWIELVEADFADIDENAGPAMRQFHEVMCSAADAMADLPTPYCHVRSSLKSGLESAGFEDVTEHVVAVKVGKVAKPELASTGVKAFALPMKALADRIDSLHLPQSVKDYLPSLPQRLAKELEERGAISKFMFVYGRKPHEKI